MDRKIDNYKTFLEALASIADEKENVLEFAHGAFIELEKEIEISSCKGSVFIKGNGAVLKGKGRGTALTIEGDKFNICGLSFIEFDVGIFIRSSKNNTKNIKVEECDFHQINNACIMTGILNSEHSIENIEITNNLFEAPAAVKEAHNAGHVACATCFFNALYNQEDHPIFDAVLKDVIWRNNKTIANTIDGNQFSEGLMAHGACNYAFFEGTDMVCTSLNDVYNCRFENLLIENNVVEGVHDIGITVLASFPGRHDNVLENVIIRNNRITYFNTGINVGATNQCSSADVSRMYARHILIENNILKPMNPGPFEPQIGIMLFTTRCESQMQNCTDCHMEDIIVKDNEIWGHEVGIQIEAQHGTQELPYPSKISNCTITDLVIENNKIHEAMEAIKISAVHMEGRIDDFWGYSVPEYDETKGFSTLAEGNVINNIKIHNNSIDEYDIALVVRGAWGCNHTFSRNNLVGPKVSIYGNILNGGHKVFCYNKYIADDILYGDAIGTNNHVYGEWTV